MSIPPRHSATGGWGHPPHDASQPQDWLVADAAVAEGTAEQVADVLARLRLRACLTERSDLGPERIPEANGGWRGGAGRRRAGGESRGNVRTWWRGMVARLAWRVSPRAAVGVLVALGVIVGLVCVRLAFSSGSGALADGVVEEGLASEAEIVVEGLDSGADGGMPADGLGVEGAAGQDGAGSVIVHVAGAVARPGVYEVPGHARVHDAVMAAGGTLAEADLEAVNLAREVVDGERIYIPVPGQTPPPVLDGGGTNPVGDGTGGGDGAGLVDLNFADATALDSLPGIGPVLADRIVAYRDKNGPFPDLEALTDVPGIGPAILENVRDSVMVE